MDQEATTARSRFGVLASVCIAADAPFQRVADRDCINYRHFTAH